jgi:hypothetical protein
MSFEIAFSIEADDQLTALENQPHLIKRLKAVNKGLAFLESNPRHPGLKTHKYATKSGPSGEEIFEAYAENNTPGAYRIFWHYGPGKDVITIIAITPHP